MLLLINGNSISHFVIISGDFTMNGSQNREPNFQTIQSYWDFFISFSNNSILLLKMVLLAI